MKNYNSSIGLETETCSFLFYGKAINEGLSASESVTPHPKELGDLGVYFKTVKKGEYFSITKQKRLAKTEKVKFEAGVSGLQGFLQKSDVFKTAQKELLNPKSPFRKKLEMIGVDPSNDSNNVDLDRSLFTKSLSAFDAKGVLNDGVDGDYGHSTRLAVAYLQYILGVKVDGAFGGGTLNVLNKKIEEGETIEGLELAQLKEELIPAIKANSSPTTEVVVAPDVVVTPLPADESLTAEGTLDDVTNPMDVSEVKKSYTLSEYRAKIEGIISSIDTRGVNIGGIKDNASGPIARILGGTDDYGKTQAQFEGVVPKEGAMTSWLPEAFDSVKDRPAEEQRTILDNLAKEFEKRIKQKEEEGFGPLGDDFLSQKEADALNDEMKQLLHGKSNIEGQEEVVPLSANQEGTLVDETNPIVSSGELTQEGALVDETNPIVSLGELTPEGTLFDETNSIDSSGELTPEGELDDETNSIVDLKGTPEALESVVVQKEKRTPYVRMHDRIQEEKGRAMTPGAIEVIPRGDSPKNIDTFKKGISDLVNDIEKSRFGDKTLYKTLSGNVAAGSWVDRVEAAANGIKDQAVREKFLGEIFTSFTDELIQKRGEGFAIGGDYLSQNEARDLNEEMKILVKNKKASMEVGTGEKVVKPVVPNEAIDGVSEVNSIDLKQLTPQVLQKNGSLKLILSGNEKLEYEVSERFAPFRVVIDLKEKINGDLGITENDHVSLDLSSSPSDGYAQRLIFTLSETTDYDYVASDDGTALLIKTFQANESIHSNQLTPEVSFKDGVLDINLFGGEDMTYAVSERMAPRRVIVDLSKAVNGEINIPENDFVKLTMSPGSSDVFAEKLEFTLSDDADYDYDYSGKGPFNIKFFKGQDLETNESVALKEKESFVSAGFMENFLLTKDYQKLEEKLNKGVSFEGIDFSEIDLSKLNLTSDTCLKGIIINPDQKAKLGSKAPFAYGFEGLSNGMFKVGLTERVQIKQ